MRSRLVAVVLLVVAALAGPLACGASAHVFFDADKRVPGAADVSVVLVVISDGQASKTPTATTKVVLHLPARNPFTGLVATAPTGWKVAQTADTVTWSGGVLAAGAQLLFPLRVQMLPRATQVTATVDQTYADGTTVTWGDQPRDPGPTPVPGATQALTQGIAHPQAQLVLDGVVAGNGSVVRQTTLPVAQAQSTAKSSSGGGTVVAVLVVVVVVTGGVGVVLARRRPVV